MNISVSRPSYDWQAVLGLVIGVYCLINLALPRVPISATITTYVLQPILWGLLAWAILAVFPKYRPAGKLMLKTTIIRLALMIGFFQILLYVIGGLFSAFGKSPYSFTPLGIFTNVIFVGSMLIGMELSRAWLINHLGKHHTFLALAFVGSLFTLLSIPLTQMTSLRLNIESITFLNSSLLPSLAENLLATLLALLAGPLAAIGYRGMLQGFWWFCPTLPDLPWAFKGLIGTAVPIVGMVVVNRFHSAKAARGKPRRRAKEASFPVGWIITSVISVVIIWFGVGLFPFHPTTVISGSMRPTMDVGDVVIIAKVPADQVKQGDIIQFRKEKVSMMHRVVEIEETEAGKFFITKGDANDQPDIDPVIPENVVGKLVFTIRKIGWAAIAVKQFLTR